MKRYRMIATLFLLVLLAACQSAPATQSSSPAPTATSVIGGQAQPVENKATDQAGYPSPNSALEANPAASGDSGSAFPIIEAYPAVAEDNEKATGEFLLDSVELMANPNKPGYTDVIVSGNLPSPCNEKRVKVEDPDSENKIAINVYSVADEDKICTQQIVPFQGIVASLGGYPSGKYSVIVNGQTAGDIEIP